MADIRPPQIDFSPLIGMGQAFGNMRREQQMQDLLTDFNGDFNAAASKLMQLGMVDEAVKIYSAGALADYRKAATEDKARPSLDDRIWDHWQSSQRPSYVAPPDTTEAAIAAEEAEAASTGVPGVSTYRTADNNMPNAIAEKLLPPEELARRRAAGGLSADREDYEAKRDIFGKRAEAVLQDLFGKLEGFDDSTVENALGPLQGVEQEGWRATLQNIPQMFGEARNTYYDGGDNSTYELRGVIKGSVNALTNAIKPFVRIKGDVWSDKDQALLTSILGDLQESQDRPELYRRFNNAVDRINAAWGFNINFRAPEASPEARVRSDTDVAGEVLPNKETSRLTPEEPATPPTQQEGTIVGGENIGRTERQPRQATPGEIASLRRSLDKYRNDPTNPAVRAIIENFDRLIGKPGSAEFYLTRSR